MAQKYPNTHASEWAWIGTAFDYVIDNNGSIDELYNQVKAIV
jgi:dephospho-CoA kinase